MIHHFVYIIHNLSSDTFYKGYSLDPSKRLIQHNNGCASFTSRFYPWELVYVEAFNNKREALQREKKLKKYSKKQLRNLIASPKNIL